MDITYGWAGAILKIDLEKRKIVKQPLPLEWRKKFIGGRGVNSWILYNETGPEVEPFDPENLLIFGTGPLNGTLSPSSGRFTVTSKSPMTGILGDANCGGHWGAELKFAGYDHILIYGKSRTPVYLWIDDDKIELRSADQLWGKCTWETQKMIKAELGDTDIQVASIGPAGENLVRFALINTGLKHSAGRTGMGAVMGSKMLKAIAVRGSKGVKIARPDEFDRTCKRIHDAIKEAPVYEALSVFGTLFLVELLGTIETMGAMNFQKDRFTAWHDISGETFIDNYSLKSKGCFGCPISCGHLYAVRKGPYAGTVWEGPEFETVQALGTRCGNSYLPSILKANKLCSEYGIDTVSTGNILGFMMELFQRGIVTEKDTDGISFNWGDYETIIKVIPMIAKRNGIGDLLAEGAFRVARSIGKGAERYVVHTKKLEHGGGDERTNKGNALAYSVSTRGADHLRGLPIIAERSVAGDIGKKIFGTRYVVDPLSYEGKAFAVKWYEDLLSLADCVQMCKFVTFWQLFPVMPKDMAELFSLATGIDMNEKAILKIAENVTIVERAYNAREGTRKHDDYPSRRFMEERVPKGHMKGEIICKEKYDKMLNQYYTLRGLDKETGIPTRKKLEELKLECVVNDLTKRGILSK